ncbi:hypothetical protein [Rubritalea tangerina]|uniref:hypothetical protein n=1 Tax=Rubritalea tangerina TaxID=430798 RepID=UPI00361B693C
MLRRSQVRTCGRFSSELALVNGAGLDSAGECREWLHWGDVWGMLGDVGGCWGMLGDVGGCWGMLGDVGGCWGMLGEGSKAPHNDVVGRAEELIVYL